ncbi:MAG: DUF6622 family protein [Ramlibacter sp.]
MLYDILLHHPEAFLAMLRGTPIWVWGLLAALVALGATQLRDRTASLLRTSLVPVGMTAFSAWGMWSAFGSTPIAPQVLAVWIGLAAGVTAAVAPGRAAGSYDPARREYRLPGSAVPLLLIVGIFATKWLVGVQLAILPRLAADPGFALPVAALYGVFNGLFAGRAARLWRLALRATTAVPARA